MYKRNNVRNKHWGFVTPSLATSVQTKIYLFIQTLPSRKINLAKHDRCSFSLRATFKQKKDIKNSLLTLVRNLNIFLNNKKKAREKDIELNTNMYHKSLRKPGGNVQINKYEIVHKKTNNNKMEI